jgi:predicted dehydrogenase
MCADMEEKQRNRMKSLYPQTEVADDYKAVLASGDIDAVVVATPPHTHHALAMEALGAGKHVFVEKPLAITGAESAEMVARADELGLKLMTGHTFVYTAAVNKVKEVIESGELGEIYYISTTRVNLGLFQENINVVWDLAPHDVSILNYILGSMPEEVAAIGHSYIQRDVEDVAFLTFRYPGSVMAHIHVSWLNPNKIRKTTVVGSKKMLVYDDISSLEKIRIYDKGVKVPPHYDTFGEFQAGRQRAAEGRVPALHRRDRGERGAAKLGRTRPRSRHGAGDRVRLDQGKRQDDGRHADRVGDVGTSALVQLKP